MQNQQAKELLLKYRKGECTEAEIALLESWYLDFRDASSDLTPQSLADAKHKVWERLSIRQEEKRPLFRLWPRLTVAASVLLCLGVGLFLYRSASTPDVESRSAKIVPGGNKAILTLADGSEISLSDAADGEIASLPGIQVTKTKEGQLVYQAAETDADRQQEVTYNTVRTPRGGMYQVNLPDGTKVWLNSSSSLRFPTAFSGNERAVQLSGEGYFEVQHNAQMPFKVSSGHQTVQVLGTHFNINAYDDEPVITTTLLQGSVRVGTGTKQAMLRPGQQAATTVDGIKVAEVVPEDAVAWVNNTFLFNQEELGSILRKISRWYDVEVICPPDLEKLQYNGVVSRTKNIQQALRVVELTGDVHFKIEGRRITVMR